jgi:hypothetical protein
VAEVVVVAVVEDHRRDGLELTLVQELGHNVLVQVALEVARLHAGALGHPGEDGDASPDIGAPVLADGEGLHAMLLDQRLDRGDVAGVGGVLVVVALELGVPLGDGLHPLAERTHPGREALGRDNGRLAGHVRLPVITNDSILPSPRGDSRGGASESPGLYSEA